MPMLSMSVCTVEPTPIHGIANTYVYHNCLGTYLPVSWFCLTISMGIVPRV